jgi:hypothetical protein
MFILPLLAAAAQPTPLTDVHQRDIGCVAVMGIIAYEQREGKAEAKDYPDVRETGKRWAGIVGQRVMDETGQPREVIAFAMKAAVNAEQAQAIAADDPKANAAKRFKVCHSRMQADLAASQPLPKPEKAQ